MAGVGVMWWTDHSEFFSRHYPDLVVTSSGPTQLGPQLWTVGTWGPRAAGVVAVGFTGAGEGVGIASNRVRFTIPSDTTADTAVVSFGLPVDGTVIRAAFGMLARPLVGDPRFRFTVWRDPASGRFPDLVVLVPLAWHPRGSTGYRQVLRYRFSDSAVAAPLPSQDTVEIRNAWPASDSASVELAPLADAAALPDGLDNTTDQYILKFTPPAGAKGASVALTLPMIVNQVSGAAAQVASATTLARAAGAAYGVHEIFGIELGLATSDLTGTPWDSVSGAGRHLAVYFPSDVSAGFLDSIPGAGEPPSFVDAVHASGGIVSIAHPFGTQVTLPTGTAAEREHGVASLGAFLVSHRAWGADLIEVGYPVRGGYYLSDHLHLLDYLLANGVRICGVATTDSHGGYELENPQLGTEDESNFVTWIGDADRSTAPAGLIASLRGCDDSFGDPFFVHGGMWISVRADSTGRQVMDMDLSGVSPSAQFFEYEGEVDSTGVPHAPVYRSYGAPVARTSHPGVGGCRPGFVRLEAWDGPRPLAFSNVIPVAADPAKCTGGATASRR